MERIAQHVHLRKLHPAGTGVQPLALCDGVSDDSLFTSLFLYLPQLPPLSPPHQENISPSYPRHSHQGRGLKRYTQVCLGKSPGLTHMDRGAQNQRTLLSTWPLGLIG